MYKEDLALNNLQWLTYNRTKPNTLFLVYLSKEYLALNNLQALICHKTDQTKSYIITIYVWIGFDIKYLQMVDML